MASNQSGNCGDAVALLMKINDENKKLVDDYKKKLETYNKKKSDIETHWERGHYVSNYNNFNYVEVKNQLFDCRDCLYGGDRHDSGCKAKVKDREICGKCIKHYAKNSGTGFKHTGLHGRGTIFSPCKSYDDWMRWNDWYVDPTLENKRLAKPTTEWKKANDKKKEDLGQKPEKPVLQALPDISCVSCEQNIEFNTDGTVKTGAIELVQQCVNEENARKAAEDAAAEAERLRLEAELDATKQAEADAAEARALRLANEAQEAERQKEEAERNASLQQDTDDESVDVIDASSNTNNTNTNVDNQNSGLSIGAYIGIGILVFLILVILFIVIARI